MTEPLFISQRDDNVSRTWVPVDACTLPTVEQPVRVAEFDTLFAESLTDVEQLSPTSARFGLYGSALLAAHAQDLADRETGCCSFFDFTVTPTGADTVVMVITVPNEGREVLGALVQRAREARERTTGRRPA